MAKQKGTWIRSKSYPWDPDGEIHVDPRWLDKAFRLFKNPEISMVMVTFRGSVTAAVATVLGRDFHRAYRNVRLVGPHNVIWDGPGTMMRAAAEIELDSSFLDGGDIAVGTDTNYFSQIPLIFEPKKADTPDAFRLPAVFLREGKEFTLNLADATPATNLTINNGTIQLYALVKDAKQKRLPAPMIWIDTPMNDDEERYRLGGLVRSLTLISPAANAGYDSWTNNVEVSSDELDMSLQRRQVLVHQAAMTSQSNVGSLNMIRDEEAFPLIIPHVGQQMGEMPDISSLLINLHQARPANARLLACVIPDRHPVESVIATGYASPGALELAVVATGLVQTRTGKFPARTFPPKLLNKLPIVLAGSRSFADAADSLSGFLGS